MPARDLRDDLAHLEWFLLGREGLAVPPESRPGTAALQLRLIRIRLSAGVYATTTPATKPSLEPSAN